MAKIVEGKNNQATPQENASTNGTNLSLHESFYTQQPRPQLLLAGRAMIDIEGGHQINPDGYIQREQEADRQALHKEQLQQKFPYHHVGEYSQELFKKFLEGSPRERAKVLGEVIINAFKDTPGAMVQAIREDPLGFVAGLAIDKAWELTPVGGLREAYEKIEGGIKAIAGARHIYQLISDASKNKIALDELGLALKSAVGASNEIASVAFDIVTEKLMESISNRRSQTRAKVTDPSGGETDLNIKPKNPSDLQDLRSNVETSTSPEGANTRTPPSVVPSNVRVAKGNNYIATIKVSAGNFVDVPGIKPAHLGIPGTNQVISALQVGQGVYVTGKSEAIIIHPTIDTVIGAPIISNSKVTGVIVKPNEHSGIKFEAVKDGGAPLISIRNQGGTWTSPVSAETHRVTRGSNALFLETDGFAYNQTDVIAGGKKYDARNNINQQGLPVPQNEPITVAGQKAMPIYVDNTPGFVNDKGSVALLRYDNKLTPFGSPAKLGGVPTVVVNNGDSTNFAYRTDGGVAVKVGNKDFSSPLPAASATILNGETVLQTQSGNIVAVSGENGYRVRKSNGEYTPPIPGKITRLNNHEGIEAKRSDGRDIVVTGQGEFIKIGNHFVKSEAGTKPSGTTPKPKNDLEPEIKITNFRIKDNDWLSASKVDQNNFRQRLPNNISDQLADDLYKLVEPPRHFTGRGNPTLTMGVLEHALKSAKETGQQIFFVQALIPSNMSAWNKHFGAIPVNKIVTELAQFDQEFIKGVEALGGRVDEITQGRVSEVNVIATGITEAQLASELTKWKNRIDNYMNETIVTDIEGQKIRLSEIDHPKAADGNKFGSPMLISKIVDLRQSQLEPSEILIAAQDQIDIQQPVREYKSPFTGTLSTTTIEELETYQTELRASRNNTQNKSYLKAPGVDKLNEFKSSASQANIEPNKAVELFNHFNRRLDPLTQMFSAGNLREALQNGINAVIQTPGLRVKAIEIDVANLSGLNILGRATADHIFALVPQILEDELRRGGLDVVGVRAGGDEFMILVASKSRDMDQIIARALKNTQEKVIKLNDIKIVDNSGNYIGKKVKDIVHPKYHDDPSKQGINLYTGIVEVNPKSTPDSIRKASSEQVEENKLQRTGL
jgi:GGDEF domain-containing protein